MNALFFWRNRSSSWPRAAIGLALLALGAVLWLAVGGESVAAVSVPASQPGSLPLIPPTITIGIAADLSGGGAAIGWAEANAVQLAVEQVNAAGGVDIGGVSYQVALVVADDQCSGAQSPISAQQLVAGGAVGVVGHTCSEATIAAEAVYDAAGVAMISPSSTSPAVTLQGRDIAFRTCPHDGSSPAQLARYLRRGLGLERSSFVAFSGVPLGSALYYSSTFTALAGTMTGFHLLDNTSEFTATLSGIKHTEQPQVIFYADLDPVNPNLSAGRAGLFSRVSYGVGMDDVIVAWNSADAIQGALDQYRARAGVAADGDLAAMEFRRFDDMPGWPDFLAAYQAAGFPNYGSNPGTYGAYAYDAARILMDAIDRADSTDPAAIRDEVAATQEYVGVVGTYAGFDGKGDISPQWGWLERNQAGKWNDVEIYSWADGFDAPTPGPLWSWVREDAAHWSLTDRPGWLRIATQPGTLLGAPNNDKNLLLMPAPPGDFYLTSELEFTPTANYHQAGLIIYQDDDNYVRLSRAYYEGGQYVELFREVDGTADVDGVEQTATHLQLQLMKRGDSYEGYYSLDGEHWTLVGQYTASLRAVQAGLGVESGETSAPDIPADFADLQLIGELPLGDYGWSDNFDKGLNAPWTWVREDAVNWSLDDRPGYMQINTQAGSLLGAGGNARNLLLRPAPPTGWQIGTRVLFTPTQNFQIAGLLLYADDDNFMLFGRAFCGLPAPVCVGNGLYFDHEQAGDCDEGANCANYATWVPLPYLAHLKLARGGSDYWGFYGEDGIYWTLIGHHVAGPSFAGARIGVATFGTPPADAETAAAFDWFSMAADYLRAFLPVGTRAYQP